MMGAKRTKRVKVRLPAAVASGIRDVLTVLLAEKRWNIYETWVLVQAKLQTATARGTGFRAVLRALETSARKLPLTAHEAAHRGARRSARALAAYVESHPESGAVVPGKAG